MSYLQVPKLPTGGNKRRMPDNPTPEMLKKMRMDTSEDSASPSTSNGVTLNDRRARVEDEDGQEGPDMDFAPGGDADYFVEEDEEGRFFGGGLTSEQKDILNIFDRAGDEGVREDVRDGLWGVIYLTQANCSPCKG